MRSRLRSCERLVIAGCRSRGPRARWSRWQHRPPVLARTSRTTLMPHAEFVDRVYAGSSDVNVMPRLQQRPDIAFVQGRTPVRVDADSCGQDGG